MKINHPLTDKLIEIEISIDDSNPYHQEVSISIDGVVTVSELSNYNSYEFATDMRQIPTFELTQEILDDIYYKLKKGKND